MLSPQVSDRIVQRSGELIQWWAALASDSESRPAAVAVGRRAAVFADPRYDTGHRPVYVLTTFEFDPGSIREGPVEHRPPPGPGAGQAPQPGQVAPGPPAVTPIHGLTIPARGILGNLPPRAQDLLQAPFAAAAVLRCAWHYEGSASRLTMFGIILAGAADVTVATGTRLIPAGHTGASAHWSLRCYRATVIRRRGT